MCCTVSESRRSSLGPLLPDPVYSRSTCGAEDVFESPNSLDQELKVDHRAEIRKQSAFEGVEEPEPEPEPDTEPDPDPESDPELILILI